MRFGGHHFFQKNCRQTAENCKLMQASETHFGFTDVGSEKRNSELLPFEVANFDLGHPVSWQH